MGEVCSLLLSCAPQVFLEQGALQILCSEYLLGKCGFILIQPFQHGKYLLITLPICVNGRSYLPDNIIDI